MNLLTTEPFVQPSTGSTAAFLAIVLAVCCALSAALSRASRPRWAAPAALAAWMALAAALSASGLLERDARPPPVMLFFACCNLAAVALALSPLGKAVAAQTPVSLLVGFQAFRLPLELVLHRWWSEGVIPAQMTFSGYNFDIITGITSLLGAVALQRRWVSEAAVLPLNALGSALLLAVMVIAVGSAPGPLRFFEGQPLLLAFHAPYSWIVTACVAGALFGHIVTFRWWAARQRGEGLPRGAEGGVPTSLAGALRPALPAARAAPPRLSRRAALSSASRRSRDTPAMALIFQASPAS